MTTVARVRRRPGRDRSGRQGHPWLFTGAVAAVDGAADAPLAEIASAEGEPLAVGFWNPRSEIRARLLRAGGAAAGAIDRAFFAERLRQALAMRERLLPRDTTGYRLFNAEGDGVPGWTLDRFGEVVVSQVTVAGLEALRAEAWAALAEVLPGVAVVQRNALPARRSEGLPEGDDVAVAGAVPATVDFVECGLRFTAEIAGGQKTGFYLDQRDNRELVAALSPGRTVLDLFAHTGAFALHALRAGADRVLAVESAARLEELARRHVADNGLAAERLEWTVADVFADLRERTERFDVVVCDPPPLVRRRADVERGARAYKDLNRLAFRRVAPGGLLLTFSCSGAVDGKLFRQILFAAAREAGVGAQLLRPLAASAADHPVAITHPEGEYLHGWLVRVGEPIL